MWVSRRKWEKMQSKMEQFESRLGALDKETSLRLVPSISESCWEEKVCTGRARPEDLSTAVSINKMVVEIIRYLELEVAPEETKPMRLCPKETKNGSNP